MDIGTFDDFERDVGTSNKITDLEYLRITFDEVVKACAEKNTLYVPFLLKPSCLMQSAFLAEKLERQYQVFDIIRDKYGVPYAAKEIKRGQDWSRLSFNYYFFFKKDPRWTERNVLYVWSNQNNFEDAEKWLVERQRENSCVIS